MSASGTEPAAPKPSPAGLFAKLSVVVLTIAQFFPFDVTGAYISHQNEDPLTTGGGYDSRGAFHHGYVAEISGGDPVIGWQFNNYAWVILPILAIVFFSRIHKNPKYNRWIYYAGIVLTIGCAGGIVPPLSTLGGMISAVALALIGYAAYLNHKAAPAT